MTHVDFQVLSNNMPIFLIKYFVVSTICGCDIPHDHDRHTDYIYTIVKLILDTFLYNIF